MRPCWRAVLACGCRLALAALCLGATAVRAIACYKCKAAAGDCNEGRCNGLACVMIEQMLVGGTQRSVEKGCSMDPERTECTSVRSAIIATKCTCQFDLCNGDDMLKASGLWPSANSPQLTAGDRAKRTQQPDEARPVMGGLTLSANHLIMILFVCLFITGSFSLLIVNAVCVHLC